MEPLGGLKILNYLLAVEGLAMIRDFMNDPDALAPRAAEVAALVGADGDELLSHMVPVHRYDVEAGYSIWAQRYDGPNPAIEAEQPRFCELVDLLTPGTALDAACGTGRHAGLLDERGWQVIGVDATEAMLAVARAKVPEADFRLGRLQDLPVEDSSIDLVTCGLALTHIEDLGPVFAEFARVLRPGGQVITTDMHPIVALTGGMAAFPIADRSPDAGPTDMQIHFVPNLVHHAHEYVTAATSAGLRITGCDEPTVTEDWVRGYPSYAAFPDATQQAFGGLPFLIIWQYCKD